LALLVGVLATSAVALGQAPDDPAARAIRAREDAVKSAVVEFERVDVVAAGAESDSAPQPFKPKNSVPDKETTLKSVNRLVFDGDKLRYEDNHPVWQMPNGELHENKHVSVY